MEAIALSEEEAEALAHLLRRSQRPIVLASREPLLKDVEIRRIDQDHVEALGKALEDVLYSELLETADKEMGRRAFKLYKRTPAGEAAERLAESTNRALDRLRGARVERISCSNVRFGVQRLEIETDRCAMVLEAQGNRITVTEVEL